MSEDAEAMLSGLIVMISGGIGVSLLMAGLSGVGLLAVLGGVLCLFVFFIGWWRAFGGNLLWRDRD